MTSAASASTHAREAGNKELRRSQADGLSDVLRKSRLQSAVRFYNNAVTEARRPEEWFSARKNLSLAHKMLAELLAAQVGEAHVIDSQRITDPELENVVYHFLEALGEIKWVLQEGGPYEAAAVLGHEWERHLIDRANDIYQCLLDWSLDRCTTIQAAVALQRRIYARLPTQALCVRCRYDEAEGIFLACTREVVQASGLRPVGSYKEVLSKLPDCKMPLLEAAAGAAKLGDVAKVDACNSLLASVEVEICVATASQAIETGDQVLRSALHNFESLNMAGVWDAIDWYHEAIVQTKERDIENEARANSHLGAVYKDVLKSKSGAKKYFSRCMELAKALMPRNLHGVHWFDTAAAALAAYQAESVANSDAEAQKAKQPLLEELKDELAAVDAAAHEGISQFLEHIYAVHPPRAHRAQGGKRDSSAELKKQLLHAIRHYHPDRCKADATKSAHENDKWAVLCEEVTKKLNLLWGREFKSDPEKGN